jgi:hypothetical protein
LGISQFGSSGSAPFSSLLSFGFMPDLHLPEVSQWNVTLERSLGQYDAASLSYVGSGGYGLIRREAGGEGNKPTALVVLTTNHGDSRYHALQAQYRRHTASGWNVLASYTWSHSLDNVSSDAFLVWAGEGAGPLNDHGSSDFDLRHSFRASTGYEFGASRRALLRGWAIDSVFQARTGFPITVLSSEQYRGITFMNAFRPDLVASEPVWLADGSAPGGKRLNPAAFRSNSGRQGTLGRNTLAGFGMTQIDLSLRREFRWSDRKRIHLRVDAFNLLNHANFADPVRYLNSPIFGQSAAMLNMMLGTGSPGSGLAPILQTGGPRSVQIGLRFAF